MNNISNAFLDNDELISFLRCPACSIGALSFKDMVLVCTNCETRFPFAGKRPVLLRSDNSLFSIVDYQRAVSDKKNWLNGLEQFVPSSSVNLSSVRVLRKIRALLDAKGICNVLVVGSGRQRVWLDALLCSVRAHHVVYTDIDITADVDLFCDAHDLPFIDSAFDAVITTAVLEHVLYPERVAAEISRVSKIGGLLYSELPFMQQVHEGAYDFTRYTLSGHRRLFNDFQEIEAGMVAGPATALVWSIENFALAFVRGPRARTLAKAMARGCFSWIKYLDYMLVDLPEAMDGASCTYFMGERVECRVSDKDIIDRYVGAKHLRHV
jgi:SAM-dependent methyltransferase